MSSKKILFMTGSGDRDIWMYKVGQKLNQQQDIKCYFIATKEKNLDNLLSLNVPKENIVFLSALKEKSKPNLAYLRECEKKYDLNIWDIWQINAERKKSRSKWNKRKILGYFQYVFKKIEEIVKNIKPDHYLCYGTAGFHAVIINKVLQKNGVKVIELYPATIPGRFRLIDNLSNIESFLEKEYIENDNKPEQNLAKKFILNFQTKPQIHDCSKKYIESFIKKIKKYYSYSFQVLKYRQLPNLNFIFWPIIQKVYDSIGIFEKPKPNEKYVLFPLHYQPEATTLIYGKWYVDQAALVENISKCLPVNYMLYVKEHPFGYGNRKLKFYKRIKRLPNVRLIGPHINNFKLIKNCSLLATITGTSGWEALLLQKPVITFGDVFYNIFEETKQVKKINELPRIIKERLDKKIDFGKLVGFVAAVFKTTYPGLARLPGDCANHSLKDENIKLLARGIIRYINQLENVKPN
ncbi:MAG: hypothetical protein ACFFDN_06215 [Candidatus Hodarchaeota archaeon]